MTSFIHREETLSEAVADQDYLRWLAEDATNCGPDDRRPAGAVGRDEGPVCKPTPEKGLRPAS
ncbi:MAG: hypothetical protein IAE77_26540 [Prosthecobacter sp.]|jgi:hypothetical protein|uniref:hypothetical protein n=1 Tax=Prosthecobacter sp. TaxID=1965333 RepID=UPI0019DBF01D|nr:hypothetical protein [Prosthecobacter sp.]MBE2287043.1 hypothetical protein [Prosthecobacter sp.]